MSAANAAAKKRRANLGSGAPPPPSIASQNNTNSSVNNTTEKSKNGLTLPQVIALVDSRLTKLEDSVSKNSASSSSVDSVSEQALKPILEEYDHRFSMLATQINDLKEIVLKLQSYTMDVNKTLLEERIHFVNEDPATEVVDDRDVGSDAIKLDDLKLEETEIVSSEAGDEIKTEAITTNTSEFEKSTDL